mmetsp:Transcript_11832/g.24945  ORF Transcript_11832/g.24945 Transcript_11832/m.24945 type:complete len:935 (-) Transcript_11832:32-2836(-)
MVTQAVLKKLPVAPSHRAGDGDGNVDGESMNRKSQNGRNLRINSAGKVEHLNCLTTAVPSNVVFPTWNMMAQAENISTSLSAPSRAIDFIATPAPAFTNTEIAHNGYSIRYINNHQHHQNYYRHLPGYYQTQAQPNYSRCNTTTAPATATVMNDNNDHAKPQSQSHTHPKNMYYQQLQSTNNRQPFSSYSRHRYHPCTDRVPNRSTASAAASRNHDTSEFEPEIKPTTFKGNRNARSIKAGFLLDRNTNNENAGIRGVIRGVGEEVITSCTIKNNTYKTSSSLKSFNFDSISSQPSTSNLKESKNLNPRDSNTPQRSSLSSTSFSEYTDFYFHGYAPTKRTKKVAKRGKWSMSRKTDLNSTMTDKKPSLKNESKPNQKGKSKPKKKSKKPVMHMTTTSKNSKKRDNESATKQVRHCDPAVAKNDEKKRKTRKSFSASKSTLGTNDAYESSPLITTQQKPRPRGPAVPTKLQTQPSGRVVKCKDDTELLDEIITHADLHLRVALQDSLESEEAKPSSDTMNRVQKQNTALQDQQNGNVVTMNRHSLQKRSANLMDSFNPTAKPENISDSEIRRIVEYASKLVASVLRSRTFLTFIHDRKETNIVIIEESRKGDSKTGPGHASGSVSAARHLDAVETNITANSSELITGTDKSIITSAIAVQRFAVEVFYPYLMASKQSMGNESPRCDRVLLSTFLALREMLITNADQLLNLQDIMRSAIVQPPGKALVFHQGGNVHNGIVGIDSCSFVARNIASMIIRLAAQKVDHHQQGSKFYEDFVAVANNYDMHSDDFRFCLRHADARSSCVLPNGEVLGEEESRIAKTSFNLARSYHPLIFNEQQEQEICLTSEKDSVDLVEKVEAKNKLVLPRANAFVTFVMTEELNRTLLTNEGSHCDVPDSQVEETKYHEKNIDLYNSLKEAQRARRSEKLRRLKGTL